MTRAFVKRSGSRTTLTWEDKYPTSFLYQSPAEIDRLKKAVETEPGRLTAPNVKPDQSTKTKK